MIRRLTSALVVATLVIAGSATAVAAAPAVSVVGVAYNQGDTFLEVTVAIPRAVDDAARNGDVPYGLRIAVAYSAAGGTVEAVAADVLISDTTFDHDIAADTVAVVAQLPLDSTPAPGANPSFNGTVGLLDPEITPLGLCQLTKEFVQSSAKYQALSAAKQAKVDALADAVCAKLAAIVPRLTPSQKASFVRLYKLGVSVLVHSGWLTSAQGATLKTLADGL